MIYKLSEAPCEESLLFPSINRPWLDPLAIFDAALDSPMLLFNSEEGFS